MYRRSAEISKEELANWRLRRSLTSFVSSLMMRVIVSEERCGCIAASISAGESLWALSCIDELSESSCNLFIFLREKKRLPKERLAW
jgi:hypothetical protein